MKLIIAGGRYYCFTPQDISDLDYLRPGVIEVVSGGSGGADARGEDWARSHGLPVRVFKADWKTHGNAAGPMRNREMARYANAVVLFPGGRGTADMHVQAIRFDLQIFDWRDR